MRIGSPIDDSSARGAASAGALRDRLEAERARLFVGREAELAALERLLEPASPTAVAYVYGPGGSGKTEVLRALQRRTEARGLAVGWIDGNAIPVNPAGFRAAFQVAFHPLPGPPPAPVCLLVVDALEYLEPLGRWLWQSFLPDLPAHYRVVLAGRDRPPAALVADPVWHHLAFVLSLDNLAGPESSVYLERRGVPAEQHEEIYARTFGYPLALALVAEVVTQSTGGVPSFAERPEVVQSLLAQLIREVPTPRHRLALWGCAVVHRLTEDLLRAMLAGEDPAPPAGAATADELYRWLQALTFVGLERRGLAPHDLVRDLLLADLGWRDPARERVLAGWAVDRLVDTLAGAGDELPGLMAEIIYAIGGRSRLIQRGGAGEYTCERLRPEDWPAVEATALRHEGPASAATVRYWLEHGGEAYGARGVDDQLTGFALFLRLDRPLGPDPGGDPALVAARDHLRREGIDRARILYFRHWMAADTYKGLSPVQAALGTLSMIVLFRHVPDLILHCEQPVERFLEVTPPGFFERFPHADFEIDGRRFGVVGVDYRAESLVAWFKRYLRSLMGLGQPTSTTTLERRQFDEAVRQALRNLHRPDLLARNALLGCGFAQPNHHPESPEAAARLRQVLLDQLDQFRASPKDSAYLRVLVATYLEPRVKQLEAAGDLGMPWGTYRRTLSVAVRRFCDALWAREHPAPPGA